MHSVNMPTCMTKATQITARLQHCAVRLSYGTCEHSCMSQHPESVCRSLKLMGKKVPVVSKQESPESSAGHYRYDIVRYHKAVWHCNSRLGFGDITFHATTNEGQTSAQVPASQQLCMLLLKPRLRHAPIKYSVESIETREQNCPFSLT